MNTWRRTFIEGLVTLTPLLLIAGVVWWLYSRLSTALPFGFPSSPILQVALTLVVFSTLVLSLGYLMRTAIGLFFDQVVHDVVNRVPGIRVLYNTVKLTLRTLLTGSGSTWNPIKIDVWGGHRMAAFETGNETPDGKAIVFIPGAPEITSGFVAEVDPEVISETDDTLLEVLVRLLSCGFGDVEEEY